LAAPNIDTGSWAIKLWYLVGIIEITYSPSSMRSVYKEMESVAGKTGQGIM
jgi:hypothetical protein